mmetsp:Transcript_64497/g.179453  ORF Transcript_64497/g.179453 Transcript_64497/m.179453 type:complete len:261 (+) Transcript_64497:177-959(+)
MATSSPALVPELGLVLVLSTMSRDSEQLFSSACAIAPISFFDWVCHRVGFGETDFFDRVLLTTTGSSRCEFPRSCGDGGAASTGPAQLVNRTPCVTWASDGLFALALRLNPPSVSKLALSSTTHESKRNLSGVPVAANLNSSAQDAEAIRELASSAGPLAAVEFGLLPQGLKPKLVTVSGTGLSSINGPSGMASATSLASSAFPDGSIWDMDASNDSTCKSESPASDLATDSASSVSAVADGAASDTSSGTSSGASPPPT